MFVAGQDHLEMVFMDVKVYMSYWSSLIFTWNGVGSCSHVNCGEVLGFYYETN